MKSQIVTPMFIKSSNQYLIDVGKRLAKGIIIVVSSSHESAIMRSMALRVQRSCAFGIASFNSSTVSRRSPVQSPLLLNLGSVVSMLKSKATFSINFLALPL